MRNEVNRLIHPLACCAILSVATFSGIGIAAITGQFSVSSGNTELFRVDAASHGKANMVDAASAAIAKPTHVGLTRRAVNSGTSAKTLVQRVGQRFSKTLEPACGGCGVVQSIERHDLQMPSVQPQGATTSNMSASMLAGTSGNAFGTGNRKYQGATSFIVRLRMEDGSLRTIYEHQHPDFAVGERVKLQNGAVVSLS